jgi:hypothetical protein
MPQLHDPVCRDAIKARVLAVSSDAKPRWGSMSVDQMMWHISQGLEISLGRVTSVGDKAPPLPKALLRFFVLDMPWPKGAPTMKAAKAEKQYDLEAERARCLKLIDEFTARPLNGSWPVHPILGMMSGEQNSRLHAKHINHHLTQFGA